MQTIRTISNISYNSDAFFRATVQKLVQRGVIDWAYWIRHKADTDETKDHIHFVIKPSKRVDTHDLANEFMELDPNNSKPLGVTARWMFTNSMDDWLLYAVHDEQYLASKGQFRNYHYEYDALESTDPDALRADWNAINRLPYNRLAFLQDAVNDHIAFAELVQAGVVPIAQRSQYEQQYRSLIKLKMDKKSNRKVSHELNDGVQTTVKCDIDGHVVYGFEKDEKIDFRG